MAEKEALFLSFVCLDYKDEANITAEQWENFTDKVFDGFSDKGKTHRVFLSLDNKNSGYLDANLFFEGCEIISNVKDAKLWSFWAWNYIRNFFNKYLFIERIVRNKWFDIIIFGMIVINMGILVLSYFPLSEDIMEWLDTIDEQFVYIFILECVMKIIGLGFKEYFEDKWN
jgi:two pore calcium channel protein 3